MSHERYYCGHRRIEWLRRPRGTCSGSCRSHRLRRYARNNWQQCSPGQGCKRVPASDSVDLRAIELDVLSQESVDAAIKTIISESGRLDVVVHNAGHMVFGPAEAFTPEQLAQLYDTNVLSTQRVNRASLPHLRAQEKGLVVWVSSRSARGGTPPYLSSLFCRQGRDGCPSGDVRWRVGPLWDRDIHYRARRFHLGNQSLQERRIHEQ